MYILHTNECALGVYAHDIGACNIHTCLHGDTHHTCNIHAAHVTYTLTCMEIRYASYI
jgi:hypothetical protein